MTLLQTMLADSPYQGYAYAYPHKTAYRPLQPPVSLRELWSGEDRKALFLYLHVPFCEMRCGFCNLFTQAKPKDDLPRRYLDVLRRQAVRVRDALAEARFARFAVGGGTPTYLDAQDLEAVFDIAETIMGADLQVLPVSMETSPETAATEKLALLRARGVKRISIGVQTFVEAEARAVARPQKTATVEAALERIRAAGFPTLNIDLIYGMPGQTMTSWLDSLRAALCYSPEELYLYPLYVRPLTSLGQSGREWHDTRLALYREARELLRDEGYTQVSMRMFRAAHAPAEAGPVYCCQEDGMIGLGCGARSYTRSLHYSGDYAVRAGGVRAILADYLSQLDEAFDQVRYGFCLDADEQRRRYVIQSLLQQDGLSLAGYARRFGSHVFDDLPELFELGSQGLAVRTLDRLHLTDKGMERSDTIGPWLYSSSVRGLMEDYAWR